MDDFWRRTAGPVPQVCRPAEPNTYRQAAPAPTPYNGDFDKQPPRVIEGQVTDSHRCLVGMRFVWDNGELLPPNTSYLLTTDRGECLQGGLDEYGRFVQTLPHGSYEAQLLAHADVDPAVASARAEMQATLDEILAAERAEAKELRKEQEGRNVVVNYFHTNFAFGKGFFLGAWGMIKSFKEMTDLVSPLNAAWNILASAWKAKATPPEGWYANFLRNYSEAQHEELVEALGFDPASITREQIAEAYEIACFIYEDGPSQDMLARFAVNYAKAQNVEEVAEFGGGAAFELVLAALLIFFTGGVGLAARGASSLRHGASLKRLGTTLQRLSRALKHARIKLKGRGQGTGTGAQTVEVPRPGGIPKETLVVPLIRDWSHLTLSERHFPHRVSIPKKTGNTMYTVSPEVVARDLQEIHEAGEKVRSGEIFKTSSGRVFGIHDQSLHPISGPGTVNITSAEYNILVTAKKKGMDNARKSLEVMTGKGIFTAEQKARTSLLLKLMQARGVQ